jgi:N-acetylneuraminic acid mutarotase
MACLIVTRTLPAFLQSEAPANVSRRTLTFAERVAYQHAIEDVYWRHRIWPKERPDPKPSLDAVMSQAQLEKKVAEYLRKSQALEDYWQRPLTAEQLQAEMDRMAKRTRQPEVLRELFAALGNDPFVIAECLARPALAERLLTRWYAYDQRIHSPVKQRAETELQAHPTFEQIKRLNGKYREVEFVRSDRRQIVGQAHRLPDEQLAGVAPALQRNNSPHIVKLNNTAWNHTAERLAAMFKKSILPVGTLSSPQEDLGQYYATAVIEKTNDHLNLATVSWPKEPLDSWLVRRESPSPSVLSLHGVSYSLPKITGGGCMNDTWSSVNSPPEARESQTAVWTGTEMIVWGGQAGPFTLFNTGGKYNPSTDSWTTTNSINAPDARTSHTAVWTGSEMIVWGGADGFGGVLNTGGRYNPDTDSWIPISLTNAPGARQFHTAVWTGSEIIVWGGDDGGGALDTGGRYNLNSDSWTSITNMAEARTKHTAVWAGNVMIVWGGADEFGNPVNTGGRYNPSTNTWTATTITNAPDPRSSHTAVWTGTVMIVWGGIYGSSNFFNTGGKYNPATDTWAGTNTAGAPDGRDLHTAVWTGTRMIV